MSLLSVSDVSVTFGGLRALRSVSFSVDDGAIAALVGPNGAGKTTMFNCLTGLNQHSGAVHFGGVDLSGKPPHKVIRLGLARTFQNLALFKSMTVLENVVVGAEGCEILRGSRQQDRVHRERAYTALDRVGLSDQADQPCATLPYGDQKLVELARCIAAEPRMLLLDEPAAGLTHHEVEALMATIRSLRDDLAITVLLVEHHMRMVMSLCEQVVVLNFGTKIAEGAPHEISQNSTVIDAYLGRSQR